MVCRHQVIFFKIRFGVWYKEFENHFLEDTHVKSWNQLLILINEYVKWCFYRGNINRTGFLGCLRQVQLQTFAQDLLTGETVGVTNGCPDEVCILFSLRSGWGMEMKGCWRALNCQYRNKIELDTCIGA